MLRSVSLGLALAAIAAPVLLDATPATAAVAISLQDRTFLGTAFRSDDAEVAQAAIAMKRATKPAVREVATTLERGHQHDSIALEALAKRIGFIPPADVGHGHQIAADSLHDVHGITFDTLYLHTQQHAHHDAIAAYRLEIARGSDPAVVAYAKATLPTLERHLALIDGALAKLSS